MLKEKEVVNQKVEKEVVKAVEPKDENTINKSGSPKIE